MRAIMNGKATKEPSTLPILLVRSSTRHLRILFLYQPLRVRASWDIFSKSLTLGGLKEACQIPANKPTPSTGFNTKKGAVIPERRHVRNDAPPRIVKMKVDEAFTAIQQRKALRPWSHPLFITPTTKIRTMRAGIIHCATFPPMPFGGIAVMSEVSSVSSPFSSFSRVLIIP